MVQWHKTVKSENSESKLSYEKRVSAEFKRLRLRIKKLEDTILGKQENDSGSILENVSKLTRG